jgi:hypothetical protein
MQKKHIPTKQNYGLNLLISIPTGLFSAQPLWNVIIIASCDVLKMVICEEQIT